MGRNTCYQTSHTSTTSCYKTSQTSTTSFWEWEETHVISDHIPLQSNDGNGKEKML